MSKASFKAGANSSSIAFDGSGQFAYVTDIGSAKICEYAVDQASGAWTQVGDFPINEVTPVLMKIEPGGKFAYVADSGGSFVSAGTIRSYRIDLPAGSLKEIGTTKITSLSFADWYHSVQSIAIDHSGRFVIAVDSKENVLAIYKIDATTGVLTEAPGSPYKIAAGGSAVFVSGEPWR